MQFKYFKAMKLVAFLLLLLMGCTHIEEPPKATGPIRELPLAEYRDTTILDMYEGSRLSWILKTQYLVKWPRTDLVRARPVDLNVYDSLGKLLVRVTADSGTVDESISFLVASGHVHGHSDKGVDITSDSLRWNKAINQISTEARVRVISEEGDVITGKGFLSDAKLDNWQILSDVHGVFQKVEERFQNAEQDTTPSGTSLDSSHGGVANPIGPVPTTQPSNTMPVTEPVAPATPSTVLPGATP
jgi:LPS export ABC transporter protein LptC